MALPIHARGDGGHSKKLPIVAAVLIVLLIAAVLVVAASTYYVLGAQKPHAEEPTTTTATTSTTAAPSTTETTLGPTTSTMEETTSRVGATTREAPSTTSTAPPTTSTISPYAGKGYRRLTLDITIPSPHCEQALLSSLRARAGVVSMSVRRRAANDTIIYDPGVISKEDLLELAASVGGSQLIDDSGI